MSRRPGTPRLLRELNDRAALELLLSAGSLTRSQLGEMTGLSKVTASQLLGRLEERGLVQVVGRQGGGRGPNAALYSVVPSCGYVAGLHVGPSEISAGIADITGRLVTEVTIDPNGSDDPVTLVHNTVMALVDSSKVPMERLRSFVIGTPGVVDPRSGDVRYSHDLPAWHDGVLDLLRRDLRRTVVIENDVNLAALAEHSVGAAAEAEDFVLLWLGGGVGMAIMLGDRLHRGSGGGAGEIGYLPVAGAPLPDDVGAPEGFASLAPAVEGAKPLSHSYQSLVGGHEVQSLAISHGFPSGSAAAAVVKALAAGADGAAFLDELAHRIALGVASVCVVLDPGLVVLSGEVGRVGGAELARRVAAAVSRLGPNTVRVATTGVTGNPVLRGALLAALDHAREEVFSSGSG
ncbi:ROK family transcriptional regulator [Allonocardiopsis opalescens]|uniref:Putative NBD/HSP70 family sugar kinase n=1 Tax=Allonocardiopsis opalescens TaxID=1144618 RepID=A0A2T0QFL7_9ACTN|nr:ROK family transcriptional regulator [Allonocardiopsis opalescens]PRY02643.1 putative NBD/HSP70 family sugar kinase [Allonocardiopsis opalescens]